MSIATSKNSSVKEGMRLINLAVSHVCSVTDINLSSRKGLAFYRRRPYISIQWGIILKWIWLMHYLLGFLRKSYG